MLNYRNTNIVVIVILLVLSVAGYFGKSSWWMFLLLLFVYSLVLFYGSYYIGSNFFMKVICSGNKTGKQIALTFDDGPVPGKTERVLAILKEQQVPACFFCIGHRVKENENLLRRIDNEGHLIGNHSYSHHFWFDLFPKKKMLEDVQEANRVIEQCISKSALFFRPPYGVTTPVMKDVLTRAALVPVGWNIRSMDTMITDEKKLFDKVSQALKPGAILLFHDSCESTISMLPTLIKHARNQGYEFARLDTLINKKAYD